MRLQQPEMAHTPGHYHRGSGSGQQHPLTPLDFPTTTTTTPASRSTTPASRSDFSSSGHRSSQAKHKSRESMGSSARGSMSMSMAMPDPPRRPSMVLEDGSSPSARKERLRRSVSEFSPARQQQLYYPDDSQDGLVMLVSNAVTSSWN